MARRQAHVTSVVDAGDENSRFFGAAPSKRSENPDSKMQTQALTKRPALTNLQPDLVVGGGKQAGPTKRDLVRQQFNARRSARLSCRGSSLCRAPPSFEIYAESSSARESQVDVKAAVPAVASDEDDEKAPHSDDRGASGDVCSDSSDCGMECEAADRGPWGPDSPMVLDASLHTLEPMSYMEIRDLEASSEYAQDIYTHLRQQEEKLTPKPTYMSKQPDITSSMRAILVDWLVEVAEEYRLHPETLFLGVSYVDRFLSAMSVIRNKLQLVGTAALYIAAKFEEIYAPEVSEFVFITDDTYTKQQVLRMEQLVLKVLSFDMAAPTIYYFLLRFAEVGKAPDTVKHLAHYLCELTLLEDDPYLQYLPSIVAGASLCLANHTLKRYPWSSDLVLYSGYNLEDFKECVHSLYSSFCNAGTKAQQAIQEKFKSSKFHCVANLKPACTLPF
ncbi:G2/mitotic-specific cyclin-A-like [Ixodes scapularis]|uniref:G2/mitotic-specific cyclin-A-like n=1 Tax=Ixodes scapularis TaxID=6945 RepID=UPI001C3951D1|nr:G2/mitotic-specific cyclin-A-like [Ixodes scapularis]